MADQRVEVEVDSGDIHIRAVHGDDGLRQWQVTHGDDYYSYTSRGGLKDTSQPDNLSTGNFKRTDVINISDNGTRYTGEFCWYSADATIFKEDGSGDAFMRSAPDYGNAPASDEFTKGWDTISAKHEEVQAKLAENPDYIRAVGEIKEKLGQERSATFFNKPSNDLIHEDAMKGMDREVPSSIYWTEELDNMDGNLMNPSSDASNTQKLDEMNLGGADTSYSGDTSLGQEVAQLMEVNPSAVPASVDPNALAPVEQTNDMNFAV